MAGGSCDPRTVLPLPLCLTPQSHAGHKFQDSLAWGSPGDAGPRWRVRAPPCWARIALRPTAVCPAPACSELTGLMAPASPLPRPFPECQQQFPGRPGDSSLSQPRGNPMPWCQQRVSLGVWGMGLRLCRAGPPEGVGGLPPPRLPCPFHIEWRQLCPHPLHPGTLAKIPHSCFQERLQKDQSDQGWKSHPHPGDSAWDGRVLLPSLVV